MVLFLRLVTLYFIICFVRAEDGSTEASSEKTEKDVASTAEPTAATEGETTAAADEAAPKAETEGTSPAGEESPPGGNEPGDAPAGEGNQEGGPPPGDDAPPVDGDEQQAMPTDQQGSTMNAEEGNGTYAGSQYRNFQTDMPSYERDRNIQINDLPERPDEDMVAIIERISYLLQIAIHPHDIQAVYRIRAPPGRTRPIIVEFHDRILRNRILMASRRAHLSADDFYQDEVSRPVYINEPLSRYHKKLLFEAKKRAQEKGYKYVWFRNSEVRVRKMEDSDPISIRTFEDLERKIY